MFGWGAAVATLTAYVVNRAAAVKFALLGNGHRPEAVITVPGVFELDMSGAALAA